MSPGPLWSTQQKPLTYKTQERLRKDDIKEDHSTLTKNVSSHVQAPSQHWKLNSGVLTVEVFSVIIIYGSFTSHKDGQASYIYKEVS